MRDVIAGERFPTEEETRVDLGTNPDTYTAAQTPHSRQLSLLLTFFIFFQLTVAFRSLFFKDGTQNHYQMYVRRNTIIISST